MAHLFEGRRNLFQLAFLNRGKIHRKKCPNYIGSERAIWHVAAKSRR